MKKRFILKGIFILALLAFIGGGILLSKFVYTDAELANYYKNKTLQPAYRHTSFLNRDMHYTVISRSDTLPILLLIHGAPGAWYGYMNTMDDSLLQQKFKMISVDRLGYGKSDYGHAELSIPLQALAIKKVMDEENASGKKVYLLGRSYGAPIAAWLAIHYPRQVEKLFMISPVIDPGKEKFFWFSSVGKWKVTQWFLPDFLNVATAEKFAHPLQMKSMLPLWSRLRVPTLVIVGAYDQVADTGNFSFAKTHIINAKASFLKINSGHLITKEQPRLIEKLLLGKS